MSSTPALLASSCSHSLPVYISPVYSAICRFSFLFTFHLYQISSDTQYYLQWVIYQLLHLRRTCHLHGEDDLKKKKKPGAFGLSIKSMLLILSLFTARKDKNKSLPIQLFGEYLQAWAGSGRLLLCSSFFLSDLNLNFPSQSRAVMVQPAHVN